MLSGSPPTRRVAAVDRRGRSVRVIGYSTGARDVLTVILVAADAEDAEQPVGEWWGANAWVSSPRDRRLYGKED